MKNKAVFLGNLIAFNLFLGQAYAGDIVIIPKLEVGLIGSNRITSEESSFLSKVTPSVDFDYDASRAGFNLSVNNSFINYSSDKLKDGTIFNLQSQGFFEITDDGLILNATSSIQNRSRSSDDISLDNLNPHDAVQIERSTLGLEYNTVNSQFYINSNLTGEHVRSQDNAEEKDGITFNFESGNGTDSKYILWSSSLNFDKYEQTTRNYEHYSGEFMLGAITNFYFNPFVRVFAEDVSGNIVDRPNENMESLGAGFNVKLGNNLSLFASFNKVSKESTLDDYFAADITWNPSDRTSLHASYGQRFFGDTYELSFQQTLGKVKTKILYKESVRAFDTFDYELNSLGYFLCPIEGFDNIGDCRLPDTGNINLIDYTFIELNERVAIKNKEYSLYREGEWSHIFDTSIAELELYAKYTFNERMESGKINESTSYGMKVNKDLNELSNLFFEIKYVDRRYDKNKVNESWQATDYLLAKLTFKRELNSTLNAEFNMQYVDKNSNRINHTYEESRVSLSFTKEF